MKHKTLAALKKHLKEYEGYTFISEKIHKDRSTRFYRVISKRDTLHRIEVWNADGGYYWSMFADFNCNIDTATGKINDTEINKFIETCEENHKKVFEEKIISVQKSFNSRAKRFKTIHV